MTKFTPTEEQQAIIDFAQNRTENLAVIARAGAAKTSTLVMLAEALPQVPILCLAFNKAIATEMTERLPKNCKAQTLHSIGYSAWRGFVTKRTTVDGRKVYKILTKEIKLLDPDDEKEAYGMISDLLRTVGEAKNCGYLPPSFKGHWKSHMTKEDFWESRPMIPTHLEIMLVERTLVASFKAALEGEIDFDDMIYCPALCSVSWPSSPLTLVDESQDLGPLDQYIISKIVRKNRIIAVGDPLQAIYGFRGALSDSMSKLIARFSMDTLKLTVTFRCGKKIVENAHWLAPDMRAPDWQIDGEVNRPMTWSVHDLSPGAAVVCRNNAPLFRLAICMITEGLAPEIRGRDIVGPIIKEMKKLGKPKQLPLATLSAIDDWEAAMLKKARDGAVGSIKDRAEIMRIVVNQTPTLGDAQEYLQALVSRDGRIYLMTGHKSKGLEFNEVWFLDPKLCVIERDQDANIKYVIETRAKHSLNYVSTGTLQEMADDEDV